MKRFVFFIFITGLINFKGYSQLASLSDTTSEKALQLAKMDAFKNNLLNKTIKAFKFTDLNNKEWNSKELRGKTVVINFWFTACKPCLQEMVCLNKLVAENKDSNVVFIAPAPENEIQVNKFLKKYVFDYNIIPSSLDYITALSIENFPTHLVIDKAGIIRKVFIGYAEDIKERLQVEIDKLK